MGAVQELPKPGDLVAGKYRIESVIGTGGMGIVLGATDTSLHRFVAMKFLAPHRAIREGAVPRFLREARAAAAIQSEHVVRVFDVSTLPNGAPFIVMEHLRGSDLAQLLATRGALPIDEACDYILQICEALGEAHTQGTVHRDLKPQNLFVTQRPDGVPCVKVLDFGISKAVDDGVAENLTATDTVMGTPLYMSPEQVRSLKNVDARADIWALGSILFELLTMAPIFQAPSASALCAMIAMDPPVPLRARRPQAPPELEAVILRCLHKDPAGRFQDVASLAEALAPFATDRGRASATRVSAVVRGTGPAPLEGRSTPAALGSSPYTPGFRAVAAPQGTMGSSPTMSDSSRVSGPPNNQPPPYYAPPGAPYGPRLSDIPVGSHPPPASHPTTQSTWQQPQTGNLGGLGREKTDSNGVVVAVSGVLTGLLLLGLIGGGVYMYASRRALSAASHATTAKTDTTPEAGPPSAVVPSPIPSASNNSAPEPPPPTPTSTASGGKKGAHGKDAGGDKEDERNAVLGHKAEQDCRYHTQQMTTFAHDDASRRHAAEVAKGFMCRGMASSRCERQVCLNACMILSDQMCIQQITYVIDHGPAPKY